MDSEFKNTMYYYVTLLCMFNILFVNVNGLTLKTSRACIIGAGYSGLGAARYMKQYHVNFTVFEATRNFGGTWHFDPHVGTDEDGLPVFSSMYNDLRTNTPRQTMEYYDFPFPEGTPSYPSATCFLDYLKSFVKHFDLLSHIQLRSLVTSVKWAGNHWNLTYTKTDTKENVTETCDFIVVANGPYNTPVWPKYDGIETFEGNMIHSHDYKDRKAYKNRKVLIVGAGASGLDLAIQLSNVTAKLVHSHHLVYNEPKFFDGYVKKPDIMAFTPKGVIFRDESFEELDDVIFCTGYDFNHPFLDESCGVTSTAKFVLPLHKQLVNIKHPSMVFIGIAKKIITRVMDAQAEYAALLASGKLKLPSQEEMLNSWLKHISSLQVKGMKIIDLNVVGSEMDQYFGNLTEEAGVVRAPPVLTAIRDFNGVNRLDDLLNYREYDYSIIDNFHYERKYNPRQNIPCPVEV